MTCVSKRGFKNLRNSLVLQVCVCRQIVATKQKNKLKNFSQGKHTRARTRKYVLLAGRDNSSLNFINLLLQTF